MTKKTPVSSPALQTTQPVTLLIIDDHTIIREGLARLLDGEDIRVVGSASNGHDGALLVKNTPADVVLIDIIMPGLNGLDAARRILQHNASANLIILSAYLDEEMLDYARQLGVKACVEKSAPIPVLRAAIHQAAGGQHDPHSAWKSPGKNTTHVSRPAALKKVIDRFKLTPREVEVLQRIAEGEANKQISGNLGITLKTVEKHRQRIMAKLGLHNTAGLTRYALANRIIYAYRLVKT